MAKITPFITEPSPSLANPEIVVPGIVAYKGIETYHNISTLHDQYDRLVGVNRSPAVGVSSSTVNELKTVGSSGGSYIASHNRGGPQPVPQQSASGTYITTRQGPRGPGLKRPDDLDEMEDVDLDGPEG